jgi:3-hydroxyisobutyrate dehydrogenase-like beta-hydroxyacid dehydrogenase
MKLAVNTLYGVQIASWAEMLTLLEQQGIGVANIVGVKQHYETVTRAEGHPVGTAGG